LALVLDKGLRGLAIYRSAYYLPSLLGGSVAVAVLWRQVFGHDGLINQFLAIFGVEGSSWLQNPDTALGTLIVLNVWTFGSPMVIFLAGLRQVPEEYYEAARVDGASVVRQFRSITLPLLTSIVFFNLILQTIGAFQAFTQAHIVSGGTGGPSDSTLFYTLYIYQKAFVSFDMGYASALAWVLLVVIGIIAAIHFTLSRYWVFYGDCDGSRDHDGARAVHDRPAADIDDATPSAQQRGAPRWSHPVRAVHAVPAGRDGGQCLQALA